jgi:uncharacterized membrane protein (DUF441 family)
VLTVSVDRQLLSKDVSELLSTRNMLDLQLIPLHYIVPYIQISNLNVFCLIIMLRILYQIDSAEVIAS